jgi:deoxyribodipyrimidine photo-lyase
MNTKKAVSIFWFRRDLRLTDNAGLYHALKGEFPVLPLFIFDTEILEKLEDKNDRRVHFIHQCLENLQEELTALGSSLTILHSNVLEAFEKLSSEYTIRQVYCNRDYEPAAIARDKEVKSFLESKTISMFDFKDQVVFEKGEILKDDGSPYTIFTPYMKKYKLRLSNFYLKSYPSEKYKPKFLKHAAQKLPSLQMLGFEKSDGQFPPVQINQNVILKYHENRDIPSVLGTSRISIHLRFGTVSVRTVMRQAIQLNEKWWNELIWREFYMMILAHFPHVVAGAFKPNYNHIAWRNNEMEFNAWCEGNTGYPIVDAGMRELNQTGFMHNRVRMIVANFLTKHLLIDWKWGEAYFAKKLLDFELSSNNGGWQWAASSGCDAAPYFRIFNPYEQSKRFDSQLLYIRKWVPEFDSLHYPAPIVDHKFARERVLKTYKNALSKEGISVG